MQHIDIFLGRLGRLLALAASLCLVVMMLQICLDVGGRYLFGAPMPSTLEIDSTSSTTSSTSTAHHPPARCHSR